MYEVLLGVALIIICVLIVGLLQKNTNRVCISRRRLDGKTVLITGGTTGIGFEVAKDYAHRGAKVIIACPFEEEGLNARNKIIKETENKNVFFKLLDLASLDSTRKFASNILSSENRLDILINNAGVGVPNDNQTSDGMHFIMQVNYYGAFLLTILLLPLLKRTGSSNEKTRILLTSSVLHQFGQIDLETLNRTNCNYRIQVYSNSKLCLVLFGKELAQRMKDLNVVVNCVDPGAVGTAIFDSGNKILGFFIKLFFNNFFKTSWEGAQTTLHVGLDKKAGEVSGCFYKNCELSKAAQRAECDKTAKVLWEESMRLVNLTTDQLELCFETQ